MDKTMGFSKIKKFIKKEIVFFVSCICAIISCFFVPIDAEYLGYFNVKTLICLFCKLVVVCGLQRTGVFKVYSKKLIRQFKNLRTLIIGLVYLTFLCGVVLSNEMALIVLLPLSLTILREIGKEDMVAFVFVLQNICANLGGMTTPIGNSSSIYLFSYFHIGVGEFFKIMSIPVLTALVIVFIVCNVFIPKEELKFEDKVKPSVDMQRLYAYLILFVIIIFMMFGLINLYAGFLLIAIGMWLLDKNLYKKIDYMLLLTFCMIFIFSGNLTRIDYVKEMATKLIVGRELFAGILSTQVICNVPTAILFSRFTTDYAPLLLAVNIGSFGTMLASLASLVAFKIYSKNFKKGKFHYLKVLTLANFSILAVLVCVSYVVLKFV